MEGVTSLLNKFADDTKTGAVATTKEQVLWIQKGLDRLWKWAGDNRLAFNADKCKVLHLEHMNGCHKYRLGDKWLKSSTCERDLRVLVDCRLNMSQQCDVVKRVNATLGCIVRSVTSRLREVLLPLYMILVYLQLEYCVQFWTLHYRKDIARLESVQHRATRMVAGLQGKPYEVRLKGLDLFSLEKRRFRDLLVTYRRVLKPVNEGLHEANLPGVWLDNLAILEMDLLSGTYLLAVLLVCIVFQSGAQEKNYTVREELPENVLIGNLLKDLNLTLDPDVPLSSPLQFKLVYKTGDVPLVRVEENTGEIFTTANRIDREKLCSGIFSENRCFYEVEVAVLPDEVFRLVKIRFLIEDINDNAPLFPSTVINISIPENTAINSRYSVPSAIDPDIGVNGIQHYELLKERLDVGAVLVNVTSGSGSEAYESGQGSPIE
ncbi:Protocadherin-11 X-linked [Varanus komodoensis]|nr:Protocadherin-11 X-linked [Varanus komodoensis]